MDTIIDLNRTNTDGNVLRTQIRRIWGVLTQPSFFFRQDFPTLGTSSLLTFGIANAWAASALSFFVQTMNSLLLSQLLDRWMRGLIPAEQAFSVWELSGKSFLYTAGALLLAPFLFLFQTFIFGSWLYFFSRLLIEDRSDTQEAVTFQAAIRIEGVALVSRWFGLVPVFGGILAFLAGIVLTMTGVRERFAVSSRRALAVVLAPYLLLGLAILVFTALFLLAFSQLPLQDLLEIDFQQMGGI